MAQTQYTGKNSLTYIFTIIKQYVTGQLANKVDKDGAKVLSTNDYTTIDKNKLTAIEAGAQVNKIESVKVNNVALEIASKAVNVTVPTKVSELQNDSNFVKSATHTSDLALKQDKLTAGSNITIQGNVISASGEILNSVAWDNITGDINNNSALQEALAAKANASELTAHTGNSDIHVTASDKQTWNAKTTMQEVEAKGYQNASQVQSAIAEAVGDITGFEYSKVEELPKTGEKGIIYLVSHSHGEGDSYDEYIWVNNAFEKIGNTDIDLSGYVLTTDLVEITNEEVQQLWDSVFTA